MLCFYVKYDLCYICNVRTALYLPYGPTCTESCHNVRKQVNSVELITRGGDALTDMSPNDTH